jgi:hypothetical protein
MAVTRPEIYKQETVSGPMVSFDHTASGQNSYNTDCIHVYTSIIFSHIMHGSSIEQYLFIILMSQYVKYLTFIRRKYVLKSFSTFHIL